MGECKLCGGKLAEDLTAGVVASWTVDIRTKLPRGRYLSTTNCTVCLKCGHVDFFVTELNDLREKLDMIEKKKKRKIGEDS